MLDAKIGPEWSCCCVQTSIPLMNVALECVSTLAGDFVSTYHLYPVQRRASRYA